MSTNTTTTTTTTITLTREEVNNFYDNEVAKQAKKCLSTASPFWSGVEYFLNWIRTKVKNVIVIYLSQLPVVGRWATRIGVSVTEFVFTVFGTMTHFLRLVFSSPQMWEKAHEAAIKAWDSNEQNGILAQNYAYGVKMAAYFLEMMKQCVERAIKAHALDVSEDEKKEISETLDKLLDG